MTEKDGSISTLERVSGIKIRKLLPKKTRKGKRYKKLEASGVVYRAGYFYVVFDNLCQIARIRDNLRKGDNCLLGSRDGEQGYEGITYDEHEDVFHAVVEIKESGTNGYFAWIHTYDNRFDLVGKARLDYEFSEDDWKEDKGFEGLTCFSRDGREYLLALCEGNRCRLEDTGEESSGGAIMVFEKGGDRWAFSREIRLPETVWFEDYSGLDMRNGKIAVVSQKESRLWVSTLNEDDWILDGGRVYEFPRNKKGKKKYCNVEGVSWLTDTRIVVVSDSKKKHDPNRCKKKQRSIHVFEVPD